MSDKKLIACIQQNKVQWEGMLIALAAHRNNLDIPFMMEHFKKQIKKCDEALGVQNIDERKTE